jgi:hypothetical protein
MPKTIAMDLGPKIIFTGGSVVLDGKVIQPIAYGYAQIPGYTVPDASGSAITSQKTKAKENAKKDCGQNRYTSGLMNAVYRRCTTRGTA